MVEQHTGFRCGSLIGHPVSDREGVFLKAAGNCTVQCEFPAEDHLVADDGVDFNRFFALRIINMIGRKAGKGTVQSERSSADRVGNSYIFEAAGGQETAVEGF